MPASELDGQHHHRVLDEVISGQLHGSIEDGDQMLRRELLRLRSVGAVALETEVIHFFSPQKVIVVATVRLVADRARLSKDGLVQVRFLELVGLIAMTGQTGADWVRLQEAWGLAGVRIVTSDAFALRSRMRYLGFVDLFDLIAVTGGAERASVAVSQNNFAVLRGRVTDFASPVGKRGMRETLHQLRLVRLMRIVALRASGRSEWLSLMRLDECFVLNIVAVDAQSRNGFGQVIIEFLFSFFADLVGCVAGIASHVESGVSAAFFRDVQTLRMTVEAQIRALISRQGLQ